MNKPLNKQLRAQFYRGNAPVFALAVFAALVGGSLNPIISWLIKELIDVASGSGQNHRRLYPAVHRAVAAEIRVGAALHRGRHAAVQGLRVPEAHGEEHLFLPRREYGHISLRPHERRVEH